MSDTKYDVRQISEIEIYYRAFFEHHPDAVYVLDLDGNYVDANPACVNVFGYSRDEFLGMSFQQVIVPKKLEVWLSSVVKQWLQGKPIAFETTILHKDGYRVDLHITDTPISVDGHIIGVFGIAKDVTEQKTTSKLLRDHVEQYESLIKYNPNGICWFLLDGTAIGANPAYEQITGYSVAELRQMDVTEALLTPTEYDLARTTFKSAFASTLELKIKHKHGHLVDVSATSVPIVVNHEQIGVYMILQDITKQKRVQKELLEIQQLYKLISENSQDIILSSCPDGIFGYVSPSVNPLLGYNPDELIGESNTHLYHPDDIPYMVQMAERVRAGEDVPRLRCRVRSKNGSYRWYETTLKFVRDEQGNVLQTVGVGRDISEQMHLQESLEHAVTMAYLVHFEWNMTSGELLYSGQAYKNLGIENTGEAFTIERFASFVHPEDVESWNQTIRKSIETGSTYDETFRIVRRDGTVRFLHSRAELVYDEAGVPVRMAGIAQDITERKLLESELQESEERYRSLVENSLDAIGVFEGRKCVFMNSIGLQMFGVTSEEIIGGDYFDFLHPSHHEESQQRLLAIASNERLMPVEYKWIRKNGEVFHAEVLGSRFSTNAIQVYIRDITERKQAYELLLRSEKLSAVGQLAAGVAHEIRNPLTALKGFTQMMREKSRGTNRRYFDIMNGEVDRIEMILNEMLVLAKPQAPKFKLQHVDLILHEVITFLFAQAMMKNVIIQTEFECDLPMVLCEEGQLKQVFVNVIKNGIEAMPSGGNLFVRLKSIGDSLLIEFVDEGEGIPEDRIPKLGEPFFTTKENGTGLGLMVSHKIISTHEGTIRISSKVGQGTTVSVILPLEIPKGQ